jgi:hypothetical protein
LGVFVELKEKKQMNTQTKFLGTIFILSIVAFCFTQPIHAQDSGAAKVYRSQFLDSRVKVKSMLDTVDRLSRGTIDNRDKMNLQEEMLALTKLIHRLQEEALSSNNDAVGRNQDPNKTLLLISQGCIAMDYMLSALSSYIDTNDRAFLGLARDGDNLINSVEKIL